MYVACVHIHVKSEHREDFIKASIENAKNTIQEPGNLRFDIIQQKDDPHRLMFYEAYRDEADMQAHKQSAHYATWFNTVSDWFVEPRQGIPHYSLFPEDAEQWAAARK